jgi:hypothetical protein
MAGRWSAAFSQVRRGELELQAVLPADAVEQAAREAGYVERASKYTAVTTMLTFLGQVLRADRSCQQAVNGLIAQQVAAEQPVCSADTSGYCKARQRLPEALFWELQRQTGSAVEDQAPDDTRWCGRRVRVVDGSTLKIPETGRNCREYPLQAGQPRGGSYPLVRILVVFSLAVGTVLEAAIRPCQGKGNGETGMLRDLADSPALRAGDVLLTDRYFAGYYDIAFWQARGLEVVTRLPTSRRVDFRSGQRLGQDDVLITWRKTPRPDWLTREQAAAVPDTLTLRAVRVHVRRPGFRTKVVIVLTTLLDPQKYPAHQIAELYRRRWQAELNLRSLKTHMEMEQLRTKRPETIRKEFVMHLIAYNGVRRLAALAAREAGVRPWSISFKGALQTLNEFLPRVHHTRYESWLQHLIHTAEQIRVDRRDRIEPYATKQRPKEYPFLNEPRARYKSRFATGR